jgi:hypothetical protein
MPEEPEITPEQLATFRRCQFVRRVFASYPCLRSIEPMDDEEGWHVSKPYHGEPYDPEKFELLEGGWDHEHCDVCWAHIEEGDSYWPNEDEDGGHVDLCEKCYPRVMGLLGRAEQLNGL